MSELNIEDLFDLAMPTIEDVSQNDESFHIAFLTNELKKKKIEADSFIDDIYYELTKNSSVATQVAESLHKGSRYVVDMSDEIKKAIDNGEIKLSIEKGKKIIAQIRQKNGQYGKKLPIKKEEFRGEVNPTQVANAIQLKALQEQIQDIAQQLYYIEKDVKEVLEGQENDRIGLYYSGISLFLESEFVTDEGLKNLLISQAIKSLSESVSQLTLSLQSSIKYLLKKEYEKAKGKRTQLIEEKMKTIHQSFAIIHQAMMVKAGIYCSQNEMVAMSMVLREYSNFIDNTIVKNAPLLAECDPNDDGTSLGIWQKRANLKLDVKELVECFTEREKVLYIGVEKEV